MPARLPLAFRLALGPELRLWAKAGHAPVLWWRDDDARGPTGPLEQLLSLARRREAPLTLAAIAGPHLTDLVRRVETEPGVEIAVHGFRHVNRQPEGRGFGEIVEGDEVEWVRSQLRATVMAFHRAGVAPSLFVPPWNNLRPQLLEALPDSPLSAVSGFDQNAGVTGGVARLDAHLDVLRWKDGARFRGTWKFLSRMRRLLKQRRLAGQWNQPIGLLTHHLDHDHATWLFLEQFLAIFPIRSRADLMGDAPAEPTALSA
ncbi:polysaccharide deacetylase family protein [Caulobacter sp. RL271]|uniref:Polysaccharide deacetylase family protein n=1 Tax=Caulobacter segnis TaxID=88688 RepID=A0ABY4ZX93_9CAUL|nr:polysaccharide deacetylase family protein [Caulobacter segnis]USQ96794.1 polysaccharide deacetylase family protein [Caulobacter segnis]